MKLFKKLAAAVLAAALALTMVGCGGNSYAMQDELLKFTIDRMTEEYGETATHTTKADDLAAALLEAANTAAAQDAYKNMDAEDLLLDEKVIQAAGIDPAATPCVVNLIDDVQFKSSGMMAEFLKMEWMGSVTRLSRFESIGMFDPRGNDKLEIGAATHKIGDKSYTLILLTYTKTTPSKI